MITANIAYIEPSQPNRGQALAILKVQVVEIITLDGRAWARVRALDCAPFPGLKDGRPYDSDWTVVDRKRLRDVTLLYPQPGRGRPSKREKTRRAEESLLRERLMGAGYERQQPA